MPLILSGNVASATAATTYSIDNSCRFNGTDAKLSKSLGAPSDADKFTWSFWIKRGNVDTQDDNYRSVIRCHSSATVYTSCTFENNDVLTFGNRQGAGAGGHKGRLITNRVFRDSSAWYHIVCVWDSGNASAGDRMKLYVNGVEETSFSTDTNPTSDEDSANLDGNTIDIGVHESSYWWDGYIAEVYFCDGQAYGPTDFGEFDSDSPTIWKPKDASGDLTFGNNGFYLDFKDSANLGNDANGGTDLTETNIAATDQMTDTPTLNYCVWNPLTKFLAPSTFSQGNLRVVNPSTDSYFMNTGTFGLSKGLWYWEVKNISSVGNLDGIGITDRESRHYQNDFPGGTARSWCLYSNGDLYNNNVNSADFADTWTTNDIMGIYLDLNANKLYFAKNGTLQNSGTGISITAATGTEYGVYFPMTGDYSTNPWTGDFNFGGGCNFALSSAVADDDGSGAFEYDPTAGTFDSASKKFYAINSKNLAEYG